MGVQSGDPVRTIGAGVRKPYDTFGILAGTIAAAVPCTLVCICACVWCVSPVLYDNVKRIRIPGNV